jgi:hypothetical protein
MPRRARLDAIAESEPPQVAAMAVTRWSSTANRRVITDQGDVDGFLEQGPLVAEVEVHRLHHDDVVVGAPEARLADTLGPSSHRLLNSSGTPPSSVCRQRSASPQNPQYQHAPLVVDNQVSDQAFAAEAEHQLAHRAVGFEPVVRLPAQQGQLQSRPGFGERRQGLGG